MLKQETDENILKKGEYIKELEDKMTCLIIEHKSVENDLSIKLSELTNKYNLNCDEFLSYKVDSEKMCSL